MESKKLSVVTGGSGYVGHALVEHLIEQGDNVKLFLLEDHPCLDSFDCEKVFGNICNAEDCDRAFQGADTVYHIAGIVDVSGKNEQLIYNVNVEGTRNVIDSCRKNNVKNLVYVSTVDVYPAKDFHGVIKEKSFFNEKELDTPYAITKALATQSVINAASKELKTCCVQPSCVIGPGDFLGSSVGAMISLYLRGGFPASLSFGRYNFVDTRDVAVAMRNAAQKGRNGECYILSGEIMTVPELFDALAASQNKNAPKIKISKRILIPLTPVVSYLFKLAHIPPVLTKNTISKLEENCNFSNEKAKTEIGFSPRTLNETLNDTIQWHKSRL